MLCYVIAFYVVTFFFFKQKTAYEMRISDWSSDVCSSDLSAQGAQIEEFVARNFAEAMARLFAKKLRLMISEGDPIAVKIDGTFKTADPSAWSGDKIGRASCRERVCQYV